MDQSLITEVKRGKGEPNLFLTSKWETKAKVYPHSDDKKSNPIAEVNKRHKEKYTRLRDRKGKKSYKSADSIFVQY